MSPTLATTLQFMAIILLALVAGSVFGIWQGYDPISYGPATFVEVHQGAVRGLNVLLPALAMASLACIVVLAFFGRSRPAVLALYVVVILGIIAGGAVTRVFNQAINADVMTWTVQSIPANWMDIRAEWWRWHLVRVFITMATLMILVGAVFVDRADLR